MKIAIVGASGVVGECVVRELHQRGHTLTGISTHPEAIPDLDRVTRSYGDANEATALVDQIKGHDVVVTSVQFTKTDPETLISAVKSSGTQRYFVVGGSGTLLVPGTNTRIMDSEMFPAAFARPAAAAARFFDLLLKETELNWTYLSPPPGFGPGERTGKFRLGRDELLVDDNGKSVVSYADYAIALADEIERSSIRATTFHRVLLTVACV